MSSAEFSERIDIEGDRPSATPVLRQDRYEPRSCRCTLVVGGVAHRVVNYSAFGIAVLATQPLDAVEARDVPLLLDEVEVARLHIRRVRSESVDGEHRIAFEIVGEPLSIQRIDAIVRVKELLVEHHRVLDEVERVPPAFREQVFSIRHALVELERLVNDLRRTAKPTSLVEERELDDTIAEVVAAHLDRLFSVAYERIGTLLDTLEPSQAKACYSFFRDQLKSLIYQSPLSERIYEKPLGYAGDFEMMNLIYRNDSIGSSLFAKCIHRYYASHPNARAVRNRATYLCGEISRLLAASTSKRVRILSVASGPALEIQMLLAGGVDLSRVELTLLDQDAAALRHAQREIRRAAHRAGAEPLVRYVHKGVANVLREGLDGRFDLIYSAGLFDYFSDPVARRVAAKLYQALSPGGQLIIGNFTTSARNRVLMELALDWNLIYRSDEDLRRLYHDIASRLRIDSEPEGINLFAVFET